MNPQTPDHEAPYVLRTDEEGIATLTLNRGSQFNSLSQAMIAALQGQLDAIAADPTVRVVVIGGAGKAFCAGHDLKEMRANRHKAFMQDLFRRCGRMVMTLTEMPQPVIARVHGIATENGTVKFTASAGLTAAHMADSSVDDLLKRAAKALHDARTGGHDRVVVA